MNIFDFLNKGIGIKEDNTNKQKDMKIIRDINTIEKQIKNTFYKILNNPNDVFEDLF